MYRSRAHHFILDEGGALQLITEQYGTGAEHFFLLRFKKEAQRDTLYTLVLASLMIYLY